MKIQYASLMLLACATSASAQTAAPVPATAPVAAPVPALTTPTPVVAVARPEAVPGAMLPANSEITLRLDQELTSKTARAGTLFNLSVSQDVMLGNFIVIPRGTPAKGNVSYRTGKGAFGKSAKMEIELTEINLNGRVIPITGHYRQEGEGNTGATVATAVAVGVFSAFVTGRSAVFPQGREFKVFTREALPISIAN